MSITIPPGDWLSKLLELITVKGRLEIRCSYGAPWQVSSSNTVPGHMPFHIITQGSAVLETPGFGGPQFLRAGDVVILLRNDQHSLHDGSGFTPLEVDNKVGVNLVVSENDGSGERLEMLCGRILISPPHDRFIRQYLPAHLIVRTDHSFTGQNDTAEQLSKMIMIMRSESTTPSLGSSAMLNALSTALFTMALRLASESEKAPLGLLALAGNPRLEPALTAIFENSAHTWTLPELAARCNMSRATLVRHFQDAVGKSANAILTDIRMARAANELISTKLSTEVVAENVGYQSVAAFRRAFTQNMGMTPGDMRRLSAKRNALSASV